MWEVFYRTSSDFLDKFKEEVSLSDYTVVAKFEDGDFNLPIFDHISSKHTQEIIWIAMNRGSGSCILSDCLVLRSMSVGDMVKDPVGQYHLVLDLGWRIVQVKEAE